MLRNRSARLGVAQQHAQSRAAVSARRIRTRLAGGGGGDVGGEPINLAAAAAALMQLKPLDCGRLSAGGLREML